MFPPPQDTEQVNFGTGADSEPPDSKARPPKCNNLSPL